MTTRPPVSRGTALALLVLVASIAWHLFSVLSPPEIPPPKDTDGRDYASYHYAVQAAAAGLDPYDKGSLEQLSRQEKTRRSVHPFFYPPPFLLAVAWALPLDLYTAFDAWFWLNELALVAACLALWWWWRPLAPGALGPLIAATVALMYAVAYSAELGQANFVVLALVLAGLWQERERPALAGALLGVACMWKMSPALLVAWWLLRRRWTAVAASIVTAVVLSLATLPLLGPAEQLRFYTQILPGFGSGDYNGLAIKIEMFANHSIPNLVDQVFPADDNALSPGGRIVTGVITLLLVGGLGWLFRRPTESLPRLAAQASAVLVAMLLVPVYTYEHHLVFALPALVLGPVAVLRGDLKRGWAVPIAFAYVILLYDLVDLRYFARRIVGEDAGLPFWLVQEAKFAGLLVLLAVSTRLGLSAGAAAEPAREAEAPPQASVGVARPTGSG